MSAGALNDVEEDAVAKDKTEAKAEGFQRGLDGKVGTTGPFQGWTDDKTAGEARTQGYSEGKRQRQRNASEKKSRGK